MQALAIGLIFLAGVVCGVVGMALYIGRGMWR